MLLYFVPKFFSSSAGLNLAVVVDSQYFPDLNLVAISRANNTDHMSSSLDEEFIELSIPVVHNTT